MTEFHVFPGCPREGWPSRRFRTERTPRDGRITRPPWTSRRSWSRGTGPLTDCVLWLQYLAALSPLLWTNQLRHTVYVQITVIVLISDGYWIW